MRLLEGLHDSPAEDSLALRNHGDLQLYYKPTDTHKISGYLFSLFFGLSTPSFEQR